MIDGLRAQWYKQKALPSGRNMDGPKFPEFKPLELEDRTFLHDFIWRSQPETSELTFTNLFIWRKHYGFQWSTLGEWLLVISRAPGRESLALPPLGPAPRREPLRAVLGWLSERGKALDPRVERAGAMLVSEVEAGGEFVAEPARDQFDYIYRTSDLIDLAGSRYHAKRNHIALLAERHPYSYARLDESHIIPCLNLAEAWCSFKRCDEDMGLKDEWDAVREALGHYPRLDLRGGVILIEGRVEAFALGELLNERTAVIHIEKANPEIPGLYAAINQEFCRNEWSSVPFLNREQDLGEEGLRKAKLSYHPAQFLEKFTIRRSGR